MLTLNLTLPMGRSSEGLLVSAKARHAGNLGHTYGKYCRRSDKEPLCRVEVESVGHCLRSLHPHDWLPYPVPHCSTLVTFSCRRLFSHASNSCLRGAFRQRGLATDGSLVLVGRTLIHPSRAVKCWRYHRNASFGVC